MTSSFGAKPAVLRCSRCGTFVDWAEARAQVVCECRPRLELPPVLVREAADAEREAALELFKRDFGRTGIVAFGRVIPGRGIGAACQTPEYSPRHRLDDQR